MTDHQLLVTIFKKKTKSPTMNRWVLEIREYNYYINYMKGTKNVVADTLSRPILLIEANHEGTWLGKSMEEMRNLQR